jgi:hypothetical protein
LPKLVTSVGSPHYILTSYEDYGAVIFTLAPKVLFLTPFSAFFAVLVIHIESKVLFTTSNSDYVWCSLSTNIYAKHLRDVPITNYTMQFLINWESKVLFLSLVLILTSLVLLAMLLI